MGRRVSGRFPGTDGVWSKGAASPAGAGGMLVHYPSPAPWQPG